MLALLLGLLCAYSIARAQGWPSRPVTLIVPSAPGGLADATARPFALAMGKLGGQNLIVDNKPGAGGAVGYAYTSRQRPDGYSLLWALNSFVTIPEVERISDRAASFPSSQFSPIALLVTDAPVLAVRAESPWKSVAELVADAKARPKAISYGTAGVYSALHLPMEMFAQSAGVSFLHVPYQGAGPALTALLAGQIDVGPQAAGLALPQVRAGKLRLLGSWSAARSALTPEVPTFREQGFDVEYAGWLVLFAPGGTPADVVGAVRALATKASEDPGFVESITKVGSQVQYMDGAALQSWLEDQARRLGDAIRRIGKVD